MNYTVQPYPGVANRYVVVDETGAFRGYWPVSYEDAEAFRAAFAAADFLRFAEAQFAGGAR